MKWFHKSQAPTDRTAVELSKAHTEQQKQAATEREATVREDSTWARQAHERNGFTALFLTTIRENHS